MSTPFTIRITKEILARAKYCGQNELESTGENCAIALALQEIFPDAFVSGKYIYPYGLERETTTGMSIALPQIARDFIKVFDSLVAMPRVRLLLPEFEFDILIPDQILEEINIDEIQNRESVQTDR